jgi:PKD repeat protein
MAGLGMMPFDRTNEDFSGEPIPDPISLTNNTFVGNNHAVSGGANVTARNNIFVGSVKGLKNVAGASTVTHSLFWNNSTHAEASNVDPATTLVQDPLFDPQYHLLPGSPAIDAGVDVGLPFNGPAPDLGAYETTPNQAPNGVIDSPAGNPGNVTINAGQSVSFTGTGSDPDGHPLTFLWNFGGGAPNATVEDPGPVTFSTAGTYTVTFTVTDSLGLADPTPDSRTITVIVVNPPADLVETALTNPPGAVAPGGSFAVTDTVQNTGGTASPASTTAYYLSPDTFRSSTAIALTGSRAVPALESGTASTGTASVTILSPTEVGIYYLLACADDTQQVAEGDETNNCVASGTRVQVVVPAFFADEVHWTITGQTSVTFDWRATDAENAISYGTAPGTYTTTVIALPPSPLPDSSAGPFWEARLTGLQENTLYYYKIGSGPEQTFRTPLPRGSSDFWIAEEADVGSSLTYRTVPPTQEQIAQDNPGIPGDDRPRFVIVAGDITYGETHGSDDVDQHFNDVMVWSRDAAYMPAWGNAEWRSSSEAGLPDDLHNYKGRFDFPNSQVSPGAPTIGGVGEDWYWFDYGNVRFIAYPERYTIATWTDWEVSVDPVMAAGQADPAITFIVTFGHRPAYSTGSHPTYRTDGTIDADNQKLAGILDGLRSKYSKYVLNLHGHSHNYERTCPIRGVVPNESCTTPDQGLVHITGAGGGADVSALADPQPWTVYRTKHLEHVKIRFTANTIEGFAICGPDLSDDDNSCTEGAVIDTWSIAAPNPSGNIPPVAALTVTPESGTAPLAVTADASGSSDPDGAIASYLFDFGDGSVIGPQTGATATHTYAAGTFTARVTVTDNAGATASATAPVTVAGGCGSGPNLVANPSFETNTSGWASYGSSTIQRVAGGADGAFALEVRGPLTTTTFGINDSPNWVATTPAAGTRYCFSAWVRSAASTGQARLRVREYLNGAPVGTTTWSLGVRLTPSWQRLAVEHVAQAAGSNLDFQVLEYDPVTGGEVFQMDKISSRIVP